MSESQQWKITKVVAVLVLLVYIADFAYKAHTEPYNNETEIVVSYITKVINEPTSETVALCGGGEFKSYMDYRAITSTTSKQWALQQAAMTNDIGVRTIDDYPLIAVTSNFGSVGDLVEVHLTSFSFYAIVGDIKDAGHDYCQSTRDGSIIEFIIDRNVVDSEILNVGSFNSIYKGSVTMINSLGGFK